MTLDERKQKIREFKTKHSLNIFIDRYGEFHFYGTEEDKLAILEKLKNLKK